MLFPPPTAMRGPCTCTERSSNVAPPWHLPPPNLQQHSEWRNWRNPRVKAGKTRADRQAKLRHLRNAVQTLPRTSRSSTSNASAAGPSTAPRWSDAPSSCLAPPPTPRVHSGPAFQTSVSAWTANKTSRKPGRRASPILTVLPFGPIATHPPTRRLGRILC